MTTKFNIHEISSVEATGSAFRLWACGTVSWLSTMGGVYLIGAAALCC